MLINLTNHPAKQWPEAQLQAASRWGEVVDMAFPVVNPDSTEEELEALSVQYVDRITALNPAAVLCQGEWIMTYMIVSLLLQRGIPVYAACSQRIAREEFLEDGTKQKIVLYKFECFRKFRLPEGIMFSENTLEQGE